MKYTLLACPSCWGLLPRGMRRRICHGTRDERFHTVAEALAWYGEHVRAGMPL